MLIAALLALAAFAAGVTGAWSPCGFSMVETLASRRASCATFAVGALVGGVVTFGALSVLGRALGAGGSGALGAAAGDGGGTALAVAAALALAAAAADAAGLRVAPQIRRQVPETWRRTLPLPLAAALYGVLLGLGFTTFVLAFAVWALAGICVALGAPATGAVVGLAFGLGRALPVVAMAPRWETLGVRLATRMAEEPRLLRALRRLDAALLVAAAAALLLGGATASADAAGPVPAQPLPDSERMTPTLVAAGALDPSASGGVVAWRLARTAGGQLYDAESPPRPIAAPQLAIGGRMLATAARTTIAVAALATPDAPLATTPAPQGVTALAVSATHVAWRAPRAKGGDELFATTPGQPAVAPLAVTGGDAQLSRPSLDGARLAYAVTTRHSSRIVVADLASGSRQTVLRSRRTQLSQPALLGDALLYVQARACDQRLRLKRADGTTRTLLTLGTTARRDAGHEPHHTTQGSEPTDCPRGTPRRTRTTLWSTALGPAAAYVTLLRPATGARPAASRIVRIARR